MCEVKTKICSECGEMKPLTSEYYHRDKNYTHGFKDMCKICRNLKDRIHYTNNKKNKESNVICSICEKDFHRKPSDIKDNNFCSRECYIEYRKLLKFPEKRNGKYTECKTCNKSIYRIQSQLKENNFCSMECVYDYLRQTEKEKNGVYIECDECNKQIYRTSSMLGDKNFCSKECCDNHRKKRVNLICEECNIEFEARESRKIGEHIFCSQKCSNTYKMKQPNINDIHNENGIIYRKCIICDEIQPLTTEYFFKQSECKEGFRTECKKCRNEKHKIKYNTDIEYKFSITLRSIVSRAFEGEYKKNSSTYEIIGCSHKKFIKWLERNFTEGMSFENYGEWVIDHHIPLSSGKTLEEKIKLSYFINLRPMWSGPNLEKSNKISEKYNNTMTIDELINEHKYEIL